MRLVLQRTIAFIVCGGIASGAVASDLELPEYYGLYAVANGRFYGIDNDERSFQPPVVVVRRADSRLTVPVQALDHEIPELPNDVSFLLFKQPGIETPQNTIERMVLFGSSWVRASRLKSPYSADILDSQENAWDTLGRTASLIPFKTKPVEGHGDMVIAVPAKTLDAGVYVLVVSPAGLTSPANKFIFAVSPVDVAAETKCVDIECMMSLAGPGDCVPSPCRDPKGDHDPKGQGDEVASGSTASAPSGAPAWTVAHTVRMAGALYRAVDVPCPPNDFARKYADSSGRYVDDPKVLHKLAEASWTYEKVVKDPGVRQGLIRVRGLLESSEAMLRYEEWQDVLARAMVEAFQAVVTDGASLAGTVPEVVWGKVRDDLLLNPKDFFRLQAQRGLEAARVEYGTMETLAQRIVAEETIDVSDLVRARESYQRASALELVFGALDAALRPRTGTDLVTEAFKSLGGQLAGLLPATGTVLTLGEVLLLVDKTVEVAEVTKGLERYRENYLLAKRIPDVVAAEIRRIEEAAVRECQHAATDTPSRSSKSSGPVGTYHRPGVAGDVLGLRADGTWFAQYGKRKDKGTYERIGDQLHFDRKVALLSLPFGTATLDGDTLTTAGGVKWVKVSDSVGP